MMAPVLDEPCQRNGSANGKAHGRYPGLAPVLPNPVAESIIHAGGFPRIARTHFASVLLCYFILLEKSLLFSALTNSKEHRPPTTDDDG